MTPTAMQIHHRHKAFHAAIAQKAAMVGKPLPVKSLLPEALPAEPDPPRMLPPIPNSIIAEAVEIVSPSWQGSIKKIQFAICKEYGVTLADLFSQRRGAEIVRPRQVAMFLCKRLTNRSLPEIARRFGGRDHTTALHAIRKIDRLIATDAELRARVVTLAESVGGMID